MNLAKLSLTCIAVLSLSGGAWAVAPTDPAAKKIYDHNYNWLKGQNNNFIAANIRGNSDEQYRERRQAALDLLREKHDLTTVPEMMDELQRASFLSAQICDILGEWKTKKALLLLQDVAADPKRPTEVRARAEKAILMIKNAEPEAGPPKY